MKVNEIKIPMIDVNDQMAVVEQISFEQGEFVEVGVTLFSISTSKVVKEVSSDYCGYIVYTVNEFDEVVAGSVVAQIYQAKEEALAKAKELHQICENSIQINASKKAIKYAAEIGLDLSEMAQDKIIKVKDVDAFIEKRKS